VKTASPARREPRSRRQHIADTATIVNRGMPDDLFCAHPL